MSTSKKYKGMLQSRLFNISQCLINPKTGEPLYDITDLEAKLRSRKSLTEWVYIVHEQDEYTEEDEARHLARLREEYKKTGDSSENGLAEYIKANQYVFAGKKKPPHVHICIRCKDNVYLAQLAKWLGIPENQIEIPNGRWNHTFRDKGKDAFYDIVKYLTHEDPAQQAKGKHLYPDSAVVANFDWRKFLTDYERDVERYGGYTKTEDKWKIDILTRGKRPSECKEEDPKLYADHIDIIKKLRKEYISSLPVPKERLNFYICGPGGAGKGLFSMAIARAIIDPEHKLPDDEIFFKVGQKQVAFDGYDGQPVIIWDDWRSIDFITFFGRGQTFELFDPHPNGIASLKNIKYGSTKLVNRINIVNSVQDFYEFIDGLAGDFVDRNFYHHEAEDKNQAFRRFPISIVIHPHPEDYYDIRISKGWLDPTCSFDKHEEHSGIGECMRELSERLTNIKLQRLLEDKTVRPITEQIHRLETRNNAHELVDLNKTDEEIIAEYEERGIGQDR